MGHAVACTEIHGTSYNLYDLVEMLGCFYLAGELNKSAIVGTLKNFQLQLIYHHQKAIVMLKVLIFLSEIVN